MGQYREQWSYLTVGSIAVGGEYLTIPGDHCISKMKSKVSDTLDEHHASDVIGGYYVAGKV